MDEEEFDSLMQSRPLELYDAMQLDARSRRRAALAAALWGSTSEDLQRQLLAPYPEIPAGFELADFRALHRSVQTISGRLNDPRNAWLSPALAASRTIVVGSERFTVLEARSEVVRRAAEHLEEH
jgi:hypothetical protein